MKADIHPDYHPVVFVDDKHEIITRSTIKSSETREIDGVEHFVVRVDISSYTHPFYTGKQRLVDTAGRVERFRQRYAKKKYNRARTAAARVSVRRIHRQRSSHCVQV